MMKLISKLAIIILAVVFFSCGEELYDTASRYAEGINLITALVQGASGGDVIVTDGRDYFRQWSVFSGPLEPSSKVYMNRRGMVFVSDGPAGNVFIYSSTSGWMSTVGPGIIYGFSERDGDSTILLGADIWVQEYSEGNWQPIIDLTAMSIGGFFKASGDGDTYIVDSSSSFYSLNNTSSPVAEVTGIINPTYYDRVDGTFYAGNNASGLGTSNDSLIFTVSSPWVAHNFAVINSYEIYAGGTDNGKPVIFSINFSIATPEFEIVYNGFSSTKGIICMSVLDSRHLAVGIRDATFSDENGLYIYSTSDRKLHKVSPLPVWALYVRR